MKLQLWVRRSASIAVQVTVVAPTGNVELVGGLQVELTGGAPPVTVTLPYVAATGWPLAEDSVKLVGQPNMIGG
jgi:hypothetical protein